MFNPGHGAGLKLYDKTPKCAGTFQKNRDKQSNEFFTDTFTN